MNDGWQEKGSSRDVAVPRRQRVFGEIARPKGGQPLSSSSLSLMKRAHNSLTAASVASQGLPSRFGYNRGDYMYLRGGTLRGPMQQS